MLGGRSCGCLPGGGGGPYSSLGGPPTGAEYELLGGGGGPYSSFGGGPYESLGGRGGGPYSSRGGPGAALPLGGGP